MDEDKNQPDEQSMKSCMRDLIAWFTESSIPYTTIGGIAVSLIAQPRLTRDIDTVVWINREDWEPFVEQAKRHGFKPRNPNPIDFAQQYRIFLFSHLATGVSVDISLGALPFESEMIARSSTVDIGRLKLKIPTPEDLIIMKILAGRPRDLTDVDSILKINKSLDLSRIRYWTNEFALLLEMPEINQRLEQLLK